MITNTDDSKKYERVMPSSGDCDPTRTRLLDPSLLMFLTGINVIFLFYIQVALGFRVARFINLYSLGYCCLFFSMLFAVFEDEMRRLRSTYRKWLFLLFAYFCFLFILGITDLDLSKSVWHTSSDIFAIFCLSGVIVAAKSQHWKVIEKTLLFHFAISTILCIFSTLTYGRALLYADVVNSPIYHFWSLQYGWPYFLLTINTGGTLRKIIAISGICTFFILSVFFLKKTPFAQGAVLIGTSLIINMFVVKRGLFMRMNVRRVMSSIGFLIIFSLTVLAGIRATGLNSISSEYGAGYGLSGLHERFMQYGSLYDTAMADYRITYEGKIVLQDISLFETVFGRGLGATIPVDSAHSSEGVSGELHNGLAKLFLKGGIVLLILWYLGWLFVMVDLIKYKQEWLVPCYSIIITAVLFSPVSGFFGNSFSFILVMLCAGRCMGKNALRVSCC